VRIRVCGICRKDDSLLLVNHAGLAEGSFWAPPGGGVEFGTSVEANLVREYKEETGLEVEPGEFLFATEFLKPPLHAIELFFTVTIKGGLLVRGTDPEMEGTVQIIKEVRFMKFTDIDALSEKARHGALLLAGGSAKVHTLKGYFRI
jgi:8-oxo-dGTP diphosphatase